MSEARRTVRAYAQAAGADEEKTRLMLQTWQRLDYPQRMASLERMRLRMAYIEPQRECPRCGMPTLKRKAMGLPILVCKDRHMSGFWSWIPKLVITVVLFLVRAKLVVKPRKAKP